MPKQLYRTANLSVEFYEEIQREAEAVKGKIGLRSLSIAQMLEVAWRSYLEHKNDPK